MNWNPGKTGDREKSLVQSAVQGDKEAFHQIFNLYARDIYAYIFFIVDNQSKAEELTDQVFVDGWKTLDQFENKKIPLLGWLYTLALNQVISHITSGDKDHQLPLKQTEPANGISLSSVIPGFDDERDKEVRNLKIRLAILKLPFDHQLIIYLRTVEGLKISTICYLTSKSENGVTQILLESYHLLRQTY